MKIRRLARPVNGSNRRRLRFGHDPDKVNQPGINAGLVALKINEHACNIGALDIDFGEAEHCRTAGINLRFDDLRQFVILVAAQPGEVSLPGDACLVMQQGNQLCAQRRALRCADPVHLLCHCERFF